MNRSNGPDSGPIRFLSLVVVIALAAVSCSSAPAPTSSPDASASLVSPESEAEPIEAAPEVADETQPTATTHQEPEASAGDQDDSQASTNECDPNRPGIAASEPFELSLPVEVPVEWGRGDVLIPMADGRLIGGGVFKQTKVLDVNDTTSLTEIPGSSSLFGGAQLAATSVLMSDLEGIRIVHSDLLTEVVGLDYTQGISTDFVALCDRKHILSLDAEMKLWDGATGALVREIVEADPLDEFAVFNAAVELSEGRVVAAQNTGQVAIYDLNAPGPALEILTGAASEAALDLALFGDGLLAIARLGGTIEVHDLIDSREVIILSGHSRRVHRLLGGLELYSASDDGSVRRWSVETATSEVVVEHEGGVAALERFIDGPLVSLGGEDGRLVLFDETG